MGPKQATKKIVREELFVREYYLHFGRYTGAGIVTVPGMDCKDMKRGSATDWLIAVKPVVCWHGWQLHTFGGAIGSRLGKGGATENADFLSLSFSISGILDSSDFFPMRESTLNDDEFCMVQFYALSCASFANLKKSVCSN